MRIYLQGDTSMAIPLFLEVEGLNPTVRLSKNGAAFGAGTGSVIPLEGGHYAYLPSAQDLDTPGPLVVKATDGDYRYDVEARVIALNPYIAPGTHGGLPTVDGANRIAGIQGAKNRLDDLHDFDPVQQDVSVDRWRQQDVADPDVPGVPKVDISHALGLPIEGSDGTIQAATASTVTLDAREPNDGRHAYTVLDIVEGTGAGQKVLLTTATGTARQYNVLEGTMPVSLDNTSRYIVVGSWMANVKHVDDEAVTGVEGRPDVNLVSVLGSNLVEQIAGRIAENLSAFFHTPSATEKTVDDVGSGSSGDSVWSEAEKNQSLAQLGELYALKEDLSTFDPETEKVQAKVHPSDVEGPLPANFVQFQGADVLLREPLLRW